MKSPQEVALRLSLLITALVCLAVTGCGKSAPTIEQVHADWVAKVNAAIKDPARAQRVGEQGGQLIDEEQSMVAALRAAADRLAVLNADHTATDQQFMAVYGDYENKRKAAQTLFKNGVFALRKEVSAEEWKEITK